MPDAPRALSQSPAAVVRAGSGGGAIPVKGDSVLTRQ